MMSRHLAIAIPPLPRRGVAALLLASLGAIALPAFGADAAARTASAPLDLKLRPALPDGPRAMQTPASSPAGGESMRERDRERERSRTGPAYGTGYEARHATVGGAGPSERPEPVRPAHAGAGRARR